MQLLPVLGKEGPLPALALNWFCAGIFPRYHLSSPALVTKCPLFLKLCGFAWIFGSSDFFKMQLCCLQVSGWNSNQLLAIGPLSPFLALSASFHSLLACEKFGFPSTPFRGRKQT